MTQAKAQLARNFVDSFVKLPRTSGPDAYTLSDDAPAWMLDAVRDIHDGRMPNDWDYEASLNVALAVLEYLEQDSERDLSECHESIDALVPVYNQERAHWLADNITRSSYIDDASENCAFTPESDIFERIGGGMYEFYGMAWRVVVDAIEAQAGDS